MAGESIKEDTLMTISEIIRDCAEELEAIHDIEDVVEAKIITAQLKGQTNKQHALENISDFLGDMRECILCNGTIDITMQKI